MTFNTVGQSLEKNANVDFCDQNLSESHGLYVLHFT